MKAPYLFHVTSQHESLAHVIVWHEPTWASEPEPSAGECDAAHGLRPTAAQESERVAVQALHAKARELRKAGHDGAAAGLERIAAASAEEGQYWTLILVGCEGERPSLGRFKPLKDMTERTIAHLIEV